MGQGNVGPHGAVLSSLSSALAVLQLFSAGDPVWTAERIIERLAFSRPTGYRYVRELVATGLLVRVASASYSLGPRIIELDYQIRQSDPLLKAGLAVINDLVASTGCEINLIGLYGEQIVTTHQQHGVERLPLSFGRGRPMPLFRGAGSKIIVANFPRTRLKKIHAGHRQQVEEAGLGADWDSFKASMATIRRAGFAVSKGELDAGFVGVAAPVFTADGEILGSVIAALSLQRLGITDLDRLVGLVKSGARRISEGIAMIGRPLARDTPARVADLAIPALHA